MTSKTRRAELVKQLEQLITEAKTAKTGVDFDAELANKLQATEGWFVKEVESDYNNHRTMELPVVLETGN